MQGLTCEGTTEKSAQLTSDLANGDLEPRQVRVAVHAAGVYGSNLSCITRQGLRGDTFVPKHEAAGIATKVGSAVTYCDVGDYVTQAAFTAMNTRTEARAVLLPHG